MTYILYKQPISLDTLNIVRYLHYCGLNYVPSTIIERNYPDYITMLPSVVHNNVLYSGLDQVAIFYENLSGINNILQKALEFKDNNPTYLINK